MKKLRLSYQITLIFLVSFIVTGLILAVSVTAGLDSFYEGNVYQKLESFGKALHLARDPSAYEVTDNIEFIIYSSTDKTYQTSDNIDTFADKNTTKLLINKAAAQQSYSQNYKNTVGDKIIYYTILNYQGFFDVQTHDVFIALTDAQMKSDMVRVTRSQVLLACVLAFALGYLVIIIWITSLASDTKKISATLKTMGENHYKTKIETARKDEIGDLVSSAEDMRIKIIENEKSKQDIIQGVSHDLKTPVAIIASYAEALKDDMCDKDTAADIISAQCARLDAKVTQLINLTRLGYIDINDRTVGTTDMKQLLGELIALYSFRSDVTISLSLSEAEFFGDRESWTIAVQNILDNAVRYAVTRIDITLEPNRIIISNDGEPIAPAALPAIFNAFEKSRGGKFGLGLSIVKKTALLFGYDVRAENLPDGVCFTVWK